MEPISVPITLTADDYLRAYRLFHQGKLSYYTTQVVSLFILIVLAVVVLVWTGYARNWMAWIPIPLVIVELIMITYKKRNRTRSQIEKNKNLTLPGILELNNEGIQVKNELTQTLYKWDYFRTVKENSEYIYFVNNVEQNNYIFIPKRVFDTPQSLDVFQRAYRQMIITESSKP